MKFNARIPVIPLPYKDKALAVEKELIIEYGHDDTYPNLYITTGSVVISVLKEIVTTENIDSKALFLIIRVSFTKSTAGNAITNIPKVERNDNCNAKLCMAKGEKISIITAAAPNVFSGVLLRLSSRESDTSQ